MSIYDDLHVAPVTMPATSSTECRYRRLEREAESLRRHIEKEIPSPRQEEVTASMIMLIEASRSAQMAVNQLHLAADLSEADVSDTE
jgi:hypothetical protein